MSGLINNTIKAEWTNADALDLQPTCNQLATDCISRQAAIDLVESFYKIDKSALNIMVFKLKQLPFAQPTDEEIQKMQDLEQVQLEKAYQLGYEEGKKDAQPEIIRCKDCKWFGRIGCAISIVDDSDKPTENDFCSFAERRDDEKTDIS